MTEPVYYTTQSGWESQQETQWTNMMNHLDTLPTAQAQLHYIFSVMIEFLVEHSDGKQSWTGYDMNASSHLESDLSNVMHDVNLCENGEGTTETVNDATQNMNDFLLQVYTDPALESDQMQTEALNSFQDLVGDNCTIVWEQTPVYYDGSSQPTYVSVPQISMTQDQEQEVLDEWDGNAYYVGDQPGTMDPSNQGYQEYLSEQSQWMNDLTTLDDACGEVDQMAQAEYSMYQSDEKMMLGTWSQANNNFIKNEQYWLQQMGNS